MLNLSDGVFIILFYIFSIILKFRSKFQVVISP